MKHLRKQITTLLKSGGNREAILEQALRTVLVDFHSETGTIHLLDRKKQSLHLAAQLGLPPKLLDAVRMIPVGKGVAGQTVAHGKPVVMCNLQTDTSGVARPAAQQSGIGGMLCVPLRNGEAIVGAIGVGTTRPYEYTPEEMQSLEEIGRLLGAHCHLITPPYKHPAPPPRPNHVSLPQMLQAAHEAWQRGDYQQSIDLLEQASRFAPNEHRILLELGHHHGFRYEFAAAEQCFEKAIRISGQQTGAFIGAGIHCAEFDRHEMGKRYFERALKRDANSVDALVWLAQMEEWENHLDIAGDLVDRALHLNGTKIQALLVRARLYRLTGQKEAAEKLLRSFVTKPDPDIWTRSQAWYELGKVLDSQARYDEAMAAFLEAKALLQPDATPEIAKQKAAQARIKRTQETLTAETLRRWHEAGETLKPPYRLSTLCGHPRSGTTLLEQVLDSHPDIISVEEKTTFYDESVAPLLRNSSVENLLEVLESVSPGQLVRARANYFRCTELLLDQPIGNCLLLDKNPSKTAIIPASLRIFPETKFLVALRDPRDVCLSCFMQPLPLAPVSAFYLTLEDTVTEYASLMGFWLSIKPKMPGPWLEVRYEDLVDDLESVARRTLEFLGVPWDARVLGFDKHAQTKIVRSPTYAEVKKPVFKTAVGRWRNYQKYLEPYLEKLELFAKAFGYE
ncbi:MAG: sulfotransferase [Verrucomicrobiota bacterium]|jgi:tetratricopeptide (TPR) repeat protein/putative methionine-R-sulfoxide reductase with GAF domain